jgi:DNA-binding NarL/FixJ family response regulator
MDTARGGAVDVAVAHPQQLIAEGLACVLDLDGINVHAVHLEADSLLDDVGQNPPDVLVLDLSLVTPANPKLLLADIRAVAPGTRIVLLADDLDRASVRAAHDCEIDGLVLETASVSEFVAAVRQVAAGQAVFPEGFLGAVRRADAGDRRWPLSDRQREVLDLLAEGLPNERIAERLFISTNTVRFHVREIYHRLGVHNRVQAARLLNEERERG